MAETKKKAAKTENHSAEEIEPVDVGGYLV